MRFKLKKKKELWSHFVRDTSKKKFTYSNRPELKIAEFWRHLPVETLTLTVFKLPPFTFKTPLVTYYCNKTIPESLLLPTISEVRALGQINFIFSWFVCKYVNVKQTCLFSLIYNCFKTLLI